LILVSLTVGTDGIISAVSSIGHETGENGILCSAVSSILRTYAVCLDRNKNVRVSAKAPKKGEFYCRIKKYGESDAGWIRGISDSLLTGLKLAEQDYPGGLKIVTEQL